MKLQCFFVKLCFEKLLKEKIMRQNIIQISSIGLIALLGFNGCGGGGSSSTSPSTSSGVQTGVFLDTVVEGLSYTCMDSKLSGKTNSKGEFSYKEGDTCSFSYGDVILGSAKAKRIMTPYDIADANSLSNMLSFLQTLDQDENLSNGIALPLNPSNSATVNFGAERGVFELELQSILYEHNMTNLIVNGSDAERHFRETILDTFDANLTDSMFEDKMVRIDNLQVILKTDKTAELFSYEDGSISSAVWSLKDVNTLDIETSDTLFEIRFSESPAQSTNILMSINTSAANTTELMQIDQFADALKPLASTNVTFSDVNESSFTIHWKNTSASETLQTLQCYKDANTQNTPLVQELQGSDATTFSASFSALEANTQYGCQIQSSNIMGTSSSSMSNVTTDTSGATEPTSHSFDELNSFSMDDGIQNGYMIALFNNDDPTIEIRFTINSSGSAIVQYSQSGTAIWQGLNYTYTVSGTTITCTLPTSGAIVLGSQEAPQQVVLTLATANVAAHTQASVGGVNYTVFSAFRNTQDTPASSTWTKTAAGAPQAYAIMSKDGTQIIGTGFPNLSLYTYDIATQATQNLTTDANGNQVMCTNGSYSLRNSVSNDGTGEKFAFVCHQVMRGINGEDDLYDKVYLYNLTSNTYELASLSGHDKDAGLPFMNANGTQIIYQTQDVDPDDNETKTMVYEYDTDQKTTTALIKYPYSFDLWDASDDLAQLVYTKTFITSNGLTLTQLVLNNDSSEVVVSSFTEGSVLEHIDARINPDGTKLFYINANQGVKSLYMYDIASGTRTSLAAKFYEGDISHNMWDVSSDGSKVVFNLDREWGEVSEIDNKAHLYILDVATKNYEEIFSEADFEGGVVATPDFTSFYLVQDGSYRSYKIAK